MDYIKLAANDNSSNLILSYGSGLNSRTKGKSPLIRNLKLSLAGDSCDDVCMESLK